MYYSVCVCTIHRVHVVYVIDMYIYYTYVYVLYLCCMYGFDYSLCHLSQLLAALNQSLVRVLTKGERSHMHAHTRTRTRTHTHAHTHT